MFNTIGYTHYVNYSTNWNIICGKDKNELILGKYKVATTENIKYVNCKECLKKINVK